MAADVELAVERNNARVMLRARVERQLEQDAELLSGDDCFPPAPYAYQPGRQLAIKIRGLAVPEPGDEAFVRATLVLIATADRDARRLAEGKEQPAEHEGAPRRKLAGRCVGCGCLLDEQTVGCHNCHCRHSMRRRAAARAA